MTPPNLANFKNVWLIKGLTVDDGFNSILDAYEMALSYGAPYTSAHVTIILINGAAPFPLIKKYIPQWVMFTPYKDDLSQTTSITITTNDGNTAIVYYKIRDTWTFKIGAGLTIENLIFDGRDSGIKNYGFDDELHINDDSPCSSTFYKLCCFVDPTTDFSLNTTSTDNNQYCL